MKITITGYRNQISFESMPFPNDGNGQDHTKAAALAWADAATRYLWGWCGHSGSSADIRHGQDCSVHGPFVSSVDDDGEGIELFAQQMKQAQLAWEQATLLGDKAADDYCDRANRQFDADSVEPESESNG
jgi:hypothetical protein